MEPMQHDEAPQQVRPTQLKPRLDFEDVESVKNMLFKFFTFIPAQVILYAKSKGLLESSNVIMCDPVLEDILQVKALHLKQLDKYVESYKRRMSARQHMTTSGLTTRKESSLKTSEERLRTIRPTVQFKKLPISRSSGCGKTALTISHREQRNQVQCPVKIKTKEASTQTESGKSSGPTSAFHSSNGTATRTGQLFRMSESFCRVMQTVNPECRMDNLVEFGEATKYLSRYVIKKKVDLFDERNIMVAIIKDDPLAEVFKVKAFHRDQAYGYIKKQLISV